MTSKKVIFITGASSGMGKETAKDLIKQNYIVYCAARSLDKMEDLRTMGGRVVYLDITDEESIKKCVNKVIDGEGKIDVLWNNAGYGLFGSVEEVSIEEARHQFDVNVFGLARITQLVIPYMREKRAGLIINTSSMGGKMYTPLGAWYHGTKHALEGISDCLRYELQPFGIKVVILEPGVINTEFGDVMIKPMMERSGGGPYKSVALSLEKLSRENYGKPTASSPASLISKTIQKIIRSNCPKTRYLVGKYAKPMVCIRKWLGDRAFDRVIRMMMR